MGWTDRQHNRILLYILFGIAVVFSIVLTVYRVPRRFSDLVNLMNLQSISKVVIVNGITGNSTVVTEPDDIDALLALVEDKSYLRSLRQSDSEGYLYAFEMYIGDHQIIRFGNTGDHININGSWYDLDKQLRYEEVDALVQQMESNTTQ